MVFDQPLGSVISPDGDSEARKRVRCCLLTGAVMLLGLWGPGHHQAAQAQSLTGRLLVGSLATQDGSGTESGAGDEAGGWEEKTWGQVFREPQAISWLLSL